MTTRRPGSEKPKLRLVGGWGHDNLGDEAILAGYVTRFANLAEIEIRSSSPAATAAALGGAAKHGVVNIVDEKSLKRPEVMPTIVCGGGYMNGSWRARFEEKLTRVRSLAAFASPLMVHSVELQNIRSGFQRRLVSSTLHGADISVRDAGSKLRMESLGLEDVDVLPDAISLLYPSVSQFFSPIRELAGMLVVNLLDIGGRPDANEGELDVSHWDDFVHDLCAEHKGRIIGLDVGTFDTDYMRRFGLPVVTTRTVKGLVSILGSAQSVLSTRMHPALISTQLGTPTVSVPYCAKVRPTLTNLGLGDILLTSLEVRGLLDENAIRRDFSTEWKSAYVKSATWIESRMSANDVG